MAHPSTHRSTTSRALIAALALAAGLSTPAWAQPAWMKQAPAKPAERQVNNNANRPRTNNSNTNTARKQPADAGPRQPARVEPRPTQASRPTVRTERAQPAPPTRTQPPDMGPSAALKNYTPPRNDNRNNDRDRDHNNRDHNRPDWNRHDRDHDRGHHDHDHHSRSNLHIHLGTGYSSYHRYRYDPYYYSRYRSSYLYRDPYLYPSYRDPIYIYNSPSAYTVYPDPTLGAYDADDLYLPPAGAAIDAARQADQSLDPLTAEQLEASKHAAAAERAARAWDDLAAGLPSMADFADLLITEPHNPMHRIGYAIGAARSGQPDRAEWAVRSALTLDALALLRIPVTAQPAAAEALNNYTAENRQGENAALTLTALRLLAGNPTAAAESLPSVQNTDPAAQGLRLAVKTALGAE